MPDRYGEIEEFAAARAHAAELESLQIAHCEFCDDHGIRLNGLYRCDHIDQAAINKRGMRLVKETMGWK